MEDPLPISPFQSPVQAVATVPGSKSITNRALLLAALSPGRVRLTNALFSRDSHIMCEALRALGFTVETDTGTHSIEIVGTDGVIPRAEAELFVGNAGTAARFLTALVCLRPGGRYSFDGDPAMRDRPMRGLTDALSRLGTSFEFKGKDGHFPFTVHTTGLHPASVEVDASASSQILSALLMIGASASAEMEIKSPGVRPAFVEITLRMIREFGFRIEGSSEQGMFSTGPKPSSQQTLQHYAIEPDVTAASYFLALPIATGSTVSVSGLTSDMKQGDAAFADVLRSIGVSINSDADGWTASHPGWFDTAQASHSAPDAIARFDFEYFSDTFLTLAALAPLLGHPVRIDGIGHTRAQETDRIAGMARELERLGQRVIEEPGSLVIFPDLDRLREIAREGVTIETYEDHRFAMSFGILGCADILGDGRPWLRIADPACCGKTFPGFFNALARLRG